MTNALTTTAKAGAALARYDDQERAQANFAAWMGGFSKSTRDMMASVWKLYSAWCDASGLEPYHLDRAQLMAFMTDNPAARATQTARFAHLKALMAEYVAQKPDDQAAARCLALLTTFNLPKARDNRAIYQVKRERRKPKALQAVDVWRQFEREWSTPEATIRNRAIMALLFYAHLRRFELASLRWDAIDFKENVITIRGKHRHDDDEPDVIAMPAPLVKFLKPWQALAFDISKRTENGAKSITGSHPTYVFCEISKAGRLRNDKPMGGESIRRICGDEFMPHDARRTAGTRMIEAGTPVNQAQIRLRHKKGDTTLGYARYVEAKKLSDINLGY